MSFQIMLLKSYVKEVDIGFFDFFKKIDIKIYHRILFENDEKWKNFLEKDDFVNYNSIYMRIFP